MQMKCPETFLGYVHCRIMGQVSCEVFGGTGHMSLLHRMHGERCRYAAKWYILLAKQWLAFL